MQKIKWGLLGALIAVSVALGAMSATVTLQKSITASTAAQLTVNDAEEAHPLYVLRSDAGELCVFQDERIIRRTGVFISSLPEEDRSLLEVGIAAGSEQVLTGLLEDLCS